LINIIAEAYLKIRGEVGYFTDSHVTNISILTKKSLKIPKGQSESVYRIRIDNTMIRRKNTKGQTTIKKTYIKN
jgi:hypothetical protein